MIKNKDKMLRCVLMDRSARLIAISGKNLVEKARELHSLSRVCTAALGRTLMMTSMMGIGLKGEDDRVTAILKGGGMAGNVVCTATPEGTVKGYIENPTLELPPAPNGKLDVALAVGWFGDLTVIKDMGLKEPYVGKSQIFSGEIAENTGFDGAEVANNELIPRSRDEGGADEFRKHTGNRIVKHVKHFIIVLLNELTGLF